MRRFVFDDWTGCSFGFGISEVFGGSEACGMTTGGEGGGTSAALVGWGFGTETVGLADGEVTGRLVWCRRGSGLRQHRLHVRPCRAIFFSRNRDDFLPSCGGLGFVRLVRKWNGQIEIKVAAFNAGNGSGLRPSSANPSLQNMKSPRPISWRRRRRHGIRCG